MIIENPLREYINIIKKEHFKEGVIFDSWVLLIFFMDSYIRIHPDKKYLLKKVGITTGEINCLNTIITNYRIPKIIVTSYILSEFFNRIRKDFKEDYKNIKRDSIKELLKFSEIIIKKDNLIQHHNFIEFGNDISLLLATKEQLNLYKYSCLLSFDGRFIESNFRKTDFHILAFNLNTLKYFY